MLDLELRKKGIGASEVGAVLGINPYQSPLDVWLEKTGQVEPFAGNEHTRRGKRWEGPIIEEYEETTGKEVQKLFDRTYVHPKYPFLLATPDAEVVALPRPLVEAKKIGLRTMHQWGEPGTDQVPEMYLLQGAQQMAVLDRPSVDFAVDLAGDFEIYHLDRDPELEGILIERVGRFWRDNVLAGVMPEIRDTERTREWLRAKYPRNVALLRPADHEEDLLMGMLKAAQEHRKAYEKTEETIKLQLQAKIGEAAGIAGDGWKVTWKLDAGKAAYSVKAQPPRRILRPTWEGE